MWLRLRRLRAKRQVSLLEVSKKPANILPWAIRW